MGTGGGGCDVVVGPVFFWRRYLDMLLVIVPCCLGGSVVFCGIRSDRTEGTGTAGIAALGMSTLWESARLTDR